jgi:hypothetical protein
MKDKQLILYNYKTYIDKFDKSQKFFKGLVKVIDLRDGSLKYVKTLKKQCISHETALGDAQAYAIILKKRNSKYVTESKIKIVDERVLS